MTLDPSLWPDADKGSSSRGNAGPNGAENSFTLDPHDEIAQVTKTLAQAGGGEFSANLALDLVLNEIVEQAFQATKATGAAIGLERDGEMICRATTGNAPHLGARVAASELSAACLTRGEVQRCSDTDADPRIDAEACRRLGFRSMLMAPIAGREGAFGILEVFADQPNAFNEKDVKTLQRLALRIVESTRASQRGTEARAVPPEPRDRVSERLKALTEPIQNPEPDNDSPTDVPKKNDVLTSILVVLVITAATLLGVVVGVRYTMKDARSKDQPLSTPTASKPVGGEQSAPRKGKTSAASVGPSKAANLARETEPPSGGLIVTEKGKVIYRVDPPANTDVATGASSSSSRIIHRVEPTYPEAAKSQHIQGPVVLDAQVLGDGTVENVAVVEGNPLLAEAAAEAVKQWKYQPFFVDGHPVARQERITVRFSLPSS